MSDFLFRINPFYKFTFLVVFATVITFIHSFWMNVWVFGACIFLLLTGTRPAQHIKALKILIPVTVFAVSLFFSGLFFGGGATGPFGGISTASTQSGMNMATRFYSFVGIGLLISLTTDPYALVKSLRTHAKLPRKFAYGMLAAIHLLPHMKTEYQNARLAFRVRGVPVGPLSLKPIFAMLVNAFRWSEMLSIAMISRGFYE
ncbi:MAG: energy-coupling factor transporter transmembrane protein EcfT [Defluviitaleaceae bacterium]|jgi:energy-coupling factor transport system permease protein|nr:energy-coupling factor transporter transmembrane protein EcfT [Defluviitaleaceae bacterium]MCL2604014.1 energy-coupling factor transporter transmembrane protein EcfT [Defluviitaleaceae bacterium]